jgi:RND family efflux transporter MFP subunit
MLNLVLNKLLNLPVKLDKRLFLLLPLLALPFFSSAEAPKSTTATPALTVTVIKPQLADFPQKISANGNIAAWQEAIIGSEANGLRLVEVNVNVGDVVKKGQLLADFATETIDADLMQAKASLLEAEATGREAINNADRARTLQNTGAMSSQQIEQYTTAAETAKARIEVAKAAVHTQQIRLKQTKIYAPDSGIISARNATVGAVVGAGTELFRLIRQSRLEWRAEVISSDLPKIKIGMKADIIAADGSHLIGKVRKLSPTVDTQTRNTIVYVDLPPNSVKAGMFAKGDFAMGQTNTIAIPQQALVLRDGFNYVFVLKTVKNQATKVSQVKVKTGKRVGNLVEIFSGITSDQSIVASGGAFLSDNDTVKVVNALEIKGLPAKKLMQIK